MARSPKQTLQVLQDMSFQRRQWRLQHAAWLIMIVVLLLAVGGLFGHGPISHAEAGTQQLAVQYERFLRQNGPMQLRIELLAQRPANGLVRLAIGKVYFDSVRVEHIMPRPVRVVSVGNDLVFEFAAGNDPAGLEISFDGSAAGLGIARGTLRLPDSPTTLPVQFQQFTYP
jgi:hypothetical protein